MNRKYNNSEKFRPHLRRINGHHYLVLSPGDLRELLEKYPEDKNEHIIVY